MSKEMDLDGFLGHSTRGPSANFLDAWKKRNPPQVRIVLHTKAPIMAVWQHAWPKIVTREKDGKEVREVWSGGFNSWESEDILTKQYKRSDSGDRDSPPVICPMSFLLEEVNRLLRAKMIDWDTELFRFVGDDQAKAKVLHAAGMLNQVTKVWETLSEVEKRDAKKRGVPGPSDAWMESMVAKCSYVFTVVDYDNLKDGIQIAKETTLVGDKMKKTIRDRMTSEGDEKGHPFKHPYVFQWSHDKNAKQFQDKYDVVAIGKLPIGEPVLKLIRDTDPPDISRYVGKGNIEDLRASMEDAYCGPSGLINFDLIFERAEEVAGTAKPDDVATANADEEDPEDVADDIVGEVEPELEAEPVSKPTAGKPSRRTRKPAASDSKYVIASRVKDAIGGEKCFAADGMELFACDECTTILRADEAKCRECGAEYEPLEIEPEPEPEPEPRTRAARRSEGGQKAPQGANGKTAQSTQRAPQGVSRAEVAAKVKGKDRLGF